MSPPRADRRKPHGVPPPPSLLMDTQGRPYGYALLGETEEPLALALWRSLRFVSLWSGCPPNRRQRLVKPPTPERDELYAAAAEHVPELRQPLSAFAGLVVHAGELHGATVAAACEAVHRWAQAEGHRDTALHFAEAAAFADPRNPRHANAAGAACRRAGLMSRATIWIARARRLAVGDATERIRSLLAMGAVMKETGRLHAAETAFLRAATAAQRRNRKRQAAEAHHDLLLLAAEQGRIEDAEEHAVRATALYPRNHARLPYLAHDLAYALVHNGDHTAGRILLDTFVRVIPAGELLPGLGTLAWAVAGEGMIQRFEELERRVAEFAAPDHEFAAASFLHLAEGARHLGLWERAAEHASAAEDAARLRHNPALLAEARELGDAIRRRASPPATDGPPSPRLVRLTRQLTSRLRRWKAPPPPTSLPAADRRREKSPGSASVS